MYPGVRHSSLCRSLVVVRRYVLELFLVGDEDPRRETREAVVNDGLQDVLSGRPMIQGKTRSWGKLEY